MIFSLERRFLLLLLLPVTLVLLATGVAGFCYARKYLLDQWTDSARLKLEKAAHVITMKLDEKLELINLIAKADDAPSRILTQAFLIQQLAAKEGVLFVDIEQFQTPVAEAVEHKTITPSDMGSDLPKGLYTIELCTDYGFCAPSTHPDALDRSLKIVRILPGGEDHSPRRLVVRIRFDSLIEPLQDMQMREGSYACLVTSSGQFLTHTLQSMADRKKLGETGDPLELKALKEIRRKRFGTIFGEGHPPDWVVGFHKIESINWYVMMFSQGRVVMQPIIEFRTYYSAAGVAAIIIIMILIHLITRSVGRSVSEITAAAARVQAGDYSVTLVEDSNDEVGKLKGSFNALVAGLKKRDLIEQTFGRYVDKKVAEELMNRPEALRLGGEKRIVTIMMSDLRNFTTIAEKLEPEVVIRMLNRYFARMIAVIERYQGIIVDFFGDSILVFFDGTEKDAASRALDAVQCALEMQDAHESFIKENMAEELPVMMMGIGIHTGEVVVGNIGTESRAKYGIVGSNVNIADRIQATASGGKVVISEQTYEAIADKTTVSFEFKVCLKGLEDHKKLYEVESVDA